VGAGCIALAGCGGSDSSTTTGTTSTGGTTAGDGSTTTIGGSTPTTGGSLTTIPTTPSSVVLSGTAATGAALADAKAGMVAAMNRLQIRMGQDPY
jgi:hypothetical protein